MAARRSGPDLARPAASRTTVAGRHRCGGRRARREAQPVQQRPQLGDQVEAASVVATVVEQPGDHQQCGLLGYVDPVPAGRGARPSSSASPASLRYHRLSRSRSVRPGAIGRNRRVARSAVVTSAVSARYRPVAKPPCATSSVTHAGVSGDRRSRTDRQSCRSPCPSSTARHISGLPPAARSPARRRRSASSARSSARSQLCPPRSRRGDAVVLARPAKPPSSPRATSTSDLEAGLEPAPSRYSRVIFPLIYSMQCATA